jgi:hypothetical protein
MKFHAVAIDRCSPPKIADRTTDVTKTDTSNSFDVLLGSWRGGGLRGQSMARSRLFDQVLVPEILNRETLRH